MNYYEERYNTRGNNILQKKYKDMKLVDCRILPDYSMKDTYNFDKERRELRFN